jgi:hypothetical protein
MAAKTIGTFVTAVALAALSTTAGANAGGAATAPDRIL